MDSVIPEQCVICYNKLTNKELKSRRKCVDKEQQVQEIFARDVIFILKILLEVPVNLLERFLEEGGSGGWSPGCWISVCGNCAGDVVEVKGIYQEILEISGRFRRCQGKVFEKLIASYNGGGVEEGSRMEVTEECRKFVNEGFSNGILEGPLVVEDVAVLTTSLLSRARSLVGDLEEEEEEEVTLATTSLDEYEEDPLSVPDYLKEDDKEEYNEEAEIKSENDSETSANDSDWKPEMETEEDENELEDKRNCLICHKSFSNLGDLNQHISQVHMVRKPVKKMEPEVKIKSWTCSAEGCGMEFVNFREFQQHNTTHRKGPPKLKCKCCDKAFHSNNTRQRHLKMVHGVNPSRPDLKTECPVCHSLHTSVHAVRVHMKLRHKDSQVYVTPEKFPCTWENCSKSFSNSESLRIHISRHEGKPGFKCSDCEESFYARQALYRHRDEVHSEGQFPCEFCGTAFKNKERLQGHVSNVHGVQRRNYQNGRKKEDVPKKKTGSRQSDHGVGGGGGGKGRSFQCGVVGCRELFSSQERLDQHTTKEHGESGTGKRLQCVHCGKGFHKKFKLTQHELLHTNQESRPFKCDMCGKGFANHHNLRCHQLNTHKAERMIKRKPETKPRSFVNRKKKTDK